MKPKIIFRVDGDDKIGHGHVYRCFGVADRVKEIFDCIFVTNRIENEIEKKISEQFMVVNISAVSNRSEDAGSLAALANEMDAKVITLDGYIFDTAYQTELKTGSSATLISIDDDQPFHYVSDIIINHASGIKPSSISCDSGCKVFLGHHYLLLRKQFIQAMAQSRKLPEQNSVLVCFGGSDPDNFTRKILDCIVGEKFIYRINIIVGSSYRERKSLSELTSKYDHVEIKSNLDAVNMVSIMQATSVAIVPASTVGLEAFATGTPLITGLTADNQKNIYNGLIAEKDVVGIGEFRSLTCNRLVTAISEVLAISKHTISNSRIGVSDLLVPLYKSLA